MTILIIIKADQIFRCDRDCHGGGVSLAADQHVSATDIELLIISVAQPSSPQTFILRSFLWASKL